MKHVVLLIAMMLASVPGLAVAQWDDENPGEGDQAQPQEQAADLQTAASGQWVYTQQDGWCWMPYGDDYTSVPANGEGEPYEYAYSQGSGWTWIAAPWIWGYGPWPYFGAYGPGRFGWYGHGWWRTPGRFTFRAGGARGARAHGLVGQGRSLRGGHFSSGS